MEVSSETSDYQQWHHQSIVACVHERIVELHPNLLQMVHHGC